MPTLAAGNAKPGPWAGGFTLLELLVVLAIVAFASVGVGFALRDGGQVRLEREALRLGALLEAARARSQAMGVVVRWRPTATGFVFEGLPSASATEDAWPSQWQASDTTAEVLDHQALNGVGLSLVLGPEPILAPQAVRLFSRAQPARQLVLASDGVRPFAVRADSP